MNIQSILIQAIMAHNEMRKHDFLLPKAGSVTGITDWKYNKASLKLLNVNVMLRTYRRQGQDPRVPETPCREKQEDRTPALSALYYSTRLVLSGTHVLLPPARRHPRTAPSNRRNRWAIHCLGINRWQMLRSPRLSSVHMCVLFDSACSKHVNNIV
jgi:hypothetical protein